MSNGQNGAPAADLNASNLNPDQSAEQKLDETQENDQAQAETLQQPEQKAAEAKKLNKLKLKVYGQELEEELPFEIEENPEAVEYLTKQLQLAKAAQKAMQENNSYKTQVEQFLSGFKSDTRSALKAMGIDPKEFAAKVIEDEIKKSQMTPEQRELEELRAEKKRLEEDQKKQKEEYEKKETQRLEQQEYERIENQMISAIDKSDLPKEPYVIKKMADYMRVAILNGVDISAEEVLPLVEREIREDLQSLIKALGEDKVEDFIGKDIFNKIRKKNLTKAKQTPAALKSSIKDVGSNKPASDSNNKEKQSIKEFFKI